MAFPRNARGSRQRTRSPILLLLVCALAGALWWLFFSSSSRILPTWGPGSGVASLKNDVWSNGLERKYLYWGNRVDCPGKHCDSCAGLGHQESSLRCALEEAMFLNRVFVMPSRMCINPIHNEKGSFTRAWAASSCAMDSLYDVDLISRTVPVILDNSKIWYHVISTSMKLGKRGLAHVEGISRLELKEDSLHSNVLLINRTASPFHGTPSFGSMALMFMECKDRTNRSSIKLPYSFLPLMAIKSLLGDYDAIHVRRGDRIKTRKDRFRIDRSLHPHLDRDTRPEFIQRRIEKWIPPGRTLFIASDEHTPGFFSPLSARYRMAYASNYSEILEPVIENNYQLFMIERLILVGARTLVKTFKEDEADLCLTDDPKKNAKIWSRPVYTLDESGAH
ncbi:unnamed protein product [Spirodela intermedia]|uniref:Uncharacterized protein n=1 Tax=Spirodela intermedia TaxID=51605 RepID=A0A7I8JDY0_SPIIN|nr:unnamed protein product [Spirodela intermedia]CAA6667955.1 unnamed protein product [Spirodela intermedia]